MKRILHILPQFEPGGGMERVVMNFFEYIDHSEYQFDILTHKMDTDVYARKIEEQGGNVIVFPRLGTSNISDITKRFELLLSTRHYDVIHCHMANAAFIYLRIAKKYSIPIRILHSHQDHYADKFSHTIRNIPLVTIGKSFANCRIAVSKKSGDFLFGNKPYLILKNGINLNNFHYNTDLRKSGRLRYHLSDDKIFIGQVGRLVPQKNPLFTLKVFSAIEKLYPSKFKFVFAGDGFLRKELRRTASELGISNAISWLGNIDDVAELDCALDALVMPSLYEGLSVSLVEAQASGLPSFVSDTISPESVASHYVHTISLRESAESWAKQITDMLLRTTSDNRLNGYDELKANGFDASEGARELEHIYSYGR